MLSVLCPVPVQPADCAAACTAYWAVAPKAVLICWRVKLAAVYLLAALADLDSAIAGADLVITGEGRTDRQTLMGKLPYQVAQRAKKLGKRCVVISGDGDGTLVGDKVITLTDKATPPRAAIAPAAALLAEKADLLLQ